MKMTLTMARRANPEQVMVLGAIHSGTKRRR
jgi:hypothetical protein